MCLLWLGVLRFKLNQRQYGVGYTLLNFEPGITLTYLFGPTETCKLGILEISQNLTKNYKFAGKKARFICLKGW